MNISKSQRITLVITAAGLAAFLIQLLIVPPIPVYLVWPVWTVLGLVIFLALLPGDKNRKGGPD